MSEVVAGKSIIISSLWLLITVLVFAGLLKLSFWQSSRANEKDLRLARISQLNQQSPLTLLQLVALSESGNNNINDYPVFIEGTFDNQYVFLLDNQVNNGVLGYRVLQVVTTETHLVLVNLGWLAGSINRQVLPELKNIIGLQQFHGHVRIVELGIQLAAEDFSQPKWPLRVQQIDLDEFSKLLPNSTNKNILPFVIFLDKNEAIGYKKDWHPIVMPPEKHRAYAFQWFALALAWLT